MNSSELIGLEAMRHFPGLNLVHDPLCTVGKAGTPLSTTPCNEGLCPSYWKKSQ